MANDKSKLISEGARRAIENFWRNRSRPEAMIRGRGYTRRKSRYNRNTWKYKSACYTAQSRAYFCCQWQHGCDMWGPGNVEVAHKIPVSVRPDLADDPDNMICLCRYHHDIHDGRRPRVGGRKSAWFHNEKQMQLELKRTS